MAIVSSESQLGFVSDICVETWTKMPAVCSLNGPLPFNVFGVGRTARYLLPKLS